MTNIFKNYLDNPKQNKKPLWIMRQAGRYLPEYREVRKNFSNFLDFCYNPEAASKVTLQPIDRYDFDAAIIFSDILVIPHILGQKIDFIEGPILEELKFDQIYKFDFTKFDEKINKVYEAINLTRSKLAKDKVLIGFAGAAWTLCCYMLGKSKNEFKELKILAYQQHEILDFLIAGLVESIKIHLSNQIESGVDIVQIFDSWAGILTGNLYDKYVIEPTKKIVSYLKNKYPSVKIIGFARDSRSKYLDYLNTNIDIMGIDQFLDIDWAAKNLSDKIMLQGNLDPLLLLIEDQEKLKHHISVYLEKVKNLRLVCNLGHGILKETPPDNVRIFREMVRKYG